MPQMNPAMWMTIFVFGGIFALILLEWTGALGLLRRVLRVTGELFLGVIAVLIFVFFPRSMGIFSEDDEEYERQRPEERRGMLNLLRRTRAEQAEYVRRAALVDRFIPSGSMAAAIATRWRPLLPGETPRELAAAFAAASCGGSSIRH